MMSQADQFNNGKLKNSGWNIPKTKELTETEQYRPASQTSYLSDSINFHTEYAVVTKIDSDNSHKYPEFVEFSSQILGKDGFGCEKFVTEV